MKLITEFPIAYDSPDHLIPHGTKNDNYTNEDFINEVHEYFKLNHELDKIKFMDLGCSGGQLAVDFHERGNISIGLEGSDYSLKHERANWPKYYEKVLFTCDITKPYKIVNEDQSGNIDKEVKFNCITAWEVIEHIKPTDLNAVFKNINDNLEKDGIFVGSIAQFSDIQQGVPLHQSVYSEATWYHNFNLILEGTDLVLYQYPFQNKVREDKGSFYICLIKEGNVNRKKVNWKYTW